MPFSPSLKWMAVQVRTSLHSTRRLGGGFQGVPGQLTSAAETLTEAEVVAPEAAGKAMAGHEWFVKGSAEAVLDMCSTAIDERGRPVALTPQHIATIHTAADLFASASLRVLALAKGCSFVPHVAFTEHNETKSLTLTDSKPRRPHLPWLSGTVRPAQVRSRQCGKAPRLCLPTLSSNSLCASSLLLFAFASNLRSH